MNTLVVIPARGGSKGIPGKNIKLLGGKPLVCHSIDHARSIASDTDICLSTDSAEIRQVAEDYGLHVPFLRPAHLATDTAPTADVLLDALERYAEIGRHYDTVLLLQPTSPLRTPLQIREAMALYGATTPAPDMVVSVCPAAANPYYDIFETGPDGTLHISKGEGLYTRRQQAPEVWQYNGAIYVINASSLRAMPMGAFKRRLPYRMDAASSLDLDTLLDWQMAELRINEPGPDKALKY